MVRRDTASFVLGWALIWLMVLEPRFYNLAVLTLAGGLVTSPAVLQAIGMIRGTVTPDSGTGQVLSPSSSSSLSGSGEDD
jgi:hypothetical protein